MPPHTRGKAAWPQGGARRGGITPACAGKSQSGQHKAGRNGDHPRVCGEKSVAGAVVASPSGSPPRVRGKVVDLLLQRRIAGITPARAGKSAENCKPRSAQRDHPRACGEKISTICMAGVFKGSPPRVRGKVRPRSWARSGRGITPARAGKSYPRNLRGGRCEDHPRACGEKLILGLTQVFMAGSPPRVRGKD